jgi:hypothetical protein
VDFYNGEAPVITIESGDNQGDFSGEWLAHPLVVTVRNTEGILRKNAANAVTFSIFTGGGALSPSNGQVATDALGRAQANYQLSSTPDETATIRATAVNPLGPTALVSFTATVGDPEDLPQGVGGVIVTRIDDTHIKVAWQDFSYNETAFRIERKVGTGTRTPVGSVAANITEFIDDDNVQPNIIYIYRVIAFNAFYDDLIGGDSPPSPPNVEDPQGDPDLDLLVNAEEMANLTDPNDEDTDDDGVHDGEDGWALMDDFAPARVGRPAFALVDLGYAPHDRVLFINDNEQVVVERPVNACRSRYFLWDKGVSTEIRMEESEYIIVTGLNNRGTIVGLMENDGTWEPEWVDPTWRDGTEDHLGDWHSVPFIWADSGATRKTLEPAGNFEDLVPPTSTYWIVDFDVGPVLVDDEDRVVCSNYFNYIYGNSRKRQRGTLVVIESRFSAWKGLEKRYLGTAHAAKAGIL